MNPQNSLQEEENIQKSAETVSDEAAEAPEKNQGTDKPQEDAAEQENRELQDAQAKAAEYLAMAQRVQADFENFRRRNESIRADSFAEGKREVATVMLPVLDNLERAADAAAGSTDEALKSGVELVLKQMSEVYKKLNVVPIDRLGDKFDPNLENAILQGTADDGEPGTVCQVLQKGYMMGEKVLRHAMVKVVPE